MLKTLRHKFICIIMVLVTVMLCIILGLVHDFTRETLERESAAALHAAADKPPSFHDMRESNISLPYMSMQMDIFGNLQVSGTIFFDGYSREELLLLWQTAAQSDGKIHALEQYDLVYLRVNEPRGVRGVFVDVSSHRAMMHNLTQVSFFVGLISFFILFWISVFLARWAVKPVENAWQQQKQFVADASHELKTPLTVITTNAELLQDPTYDELSRQRSQGSILTMAYQMRGLVENLLELARVDNGSVIASFVQLDLSRMVEDVLLIFEVPYYENGLMLVSDIQDGIVCHGSESHLRQVLDILLDNAMKYAYPNSEVSVRLTRHGNHCLLTVANLGDYIPPQELKNIFKRFYRLDKARTRDGSYGLGLSIAQSIIEEHRGRIWAESRDGTNTFFVQLNIS